MFCFVWFIFVLFSAIFWFRLYDGTDLHVDLSLEGWGRAKIISEGRGVRYNKIIVTSKDTDQPVHPPSIDRVLVYPSLDSPEAVEVHAISQDSDQTARIRVLI